MEMTFTGERFVPELRGQIAYEHRHRYAICFEPARDRDVLDIACGEGYGASLLAPVARSVVGIDIDEASIRHAAARYPATNLSFRTGSATNLPLPDDSIDLVVSFETLEHLAEQREMLSEFVRVLRPDGRLVISSPNKHVYSDAHGFTNEFHVRELYFDEFRDLLAEFFPAFRLFGQRIFGGSAIHPLHGTAEDTEWLDRVGHANRGMAALPDPEYFIAVCVRRADTDIPNVASVYLDPSDDMLQDIRGGGLAATYVAPSVAPSSAKVDDDHRRELSEESMLERERLLERMSAVERERDEARAELVARTAAAERERDEARALFDARAAAAERERDEARAELVERTAAMERERDEARAEFDARVATIERERDEARAKSDARIATMERERDEARAEFDARSEEAREERDRLDERATGAERELEGARSQIAEIEQHLLAVGRDRDEVRANLGAVIEDLQRVRADSEERIAEIQRELEAARAESSVIAAEVERERGRTADTERELEGAREARIALDAKFEETMARVGSLERARERLHEQIARLEAERDRDRTQIDVLQENLAAREERVRGLEGEVGELATELRDAAEESDYRRTAGLELTSDVARLQAALGRSGSVVRALGLAQVRAAAAIASLERTRLRLEFDLSVRVAASEAKAARSASTARRLRSELALVGKTLALREGRIGTLESSLRDVATHNVLAVEAELEHYRAMNARLRASKFWKIRRVVRQTLGRHAD